MKAKVKTILKWIGWGFGGVAYGWVVLTSPLWLTALVSLVVGVFMVPKGR